MPYSFSRVSFFWAQLASNSFWNRDLSWPWSVALMWSRALSSETPVVVKGGRVAMMSARVKSS